MSSPSRSSIVDRLLASGVVAVVRLDDPAPMSDVIRALVRGGVTAIEITMTVPGALSLIEQAAETFGDEITLGVGSVLDAAGARDAVAAGAQFVVSPILKRDVVEAGHALDVAVLPGAFTPTEIQTAHEMGADVVKVFPADVLGMAFFKGVLAPMPHLRLMPTGGVTLANAGDWLHAGACAVGAGSALLDKKAIAEGRFDVLTENARTIIASVQSARSG